nr:RNA-directed DNA polymerase, eukaryota [Tanacetum cinerariifolium]
MESFDAGNDFKEPTCAELIGGKDSGEGSQPTRSKLTEEAEHKKSGDARKWKEHHVEESISDEVSELRWVWSLESSCEFSVKMARSHIDDFFFPSVGDPTRWIKMVSIMINIFAWKVRLDRLPMRINLSLRGIDLPFIICPICCCTGETCSHLLFTCNVARQILCKVARWWELDILKFHSYEDWLAWLTSLRLYKRLKEVLKGVFYVMWWVI